MDTNSFPKAYRMLTIVTLGILIIGTIFYHYIEQWSWLDSLYFSVVTLATVGYGDFTPQTDIGKMFTILYIFLGVGILSAFIRSLFIRAQERREKKRKSKRGD